MMKVFFIVVLLMLGCASASTQPPTQQITNDVPKQADVNGSTWKMTLPTTWLIQVRQREPNDKQHYMVELLARTNEEDPELVVALNVTQLQQDDPGDDEYGPAAVLAEIVAKKVTVVAARQVMIDGKIGAEAMLFWPSGGYALQYSVAHKRTGFAIRCGSKSLKREAVIQSCSKILDTFHTTN